MLGYKNLISLPCLLLGFLTPPDMALSGYTPAYGQVGVGGLTLAFFFCYGVGKRPPLYFCDKMPTTIH